MISSIRRALENKVTRYLVWGALALIMLMTSLPMLLDRQSSRNQWILSINNHSYDQKQLQQEVESYVKFAQFKFGPYAQLILQQLDMNGLLEIIVQQEVLKAFGDQERIAVGQQAVDKRLKQELESRGKQAKLEAVTPEGNLDMSVVRQLIAPLTYRQLKAITASDLQRQVLVDGAQAAAFVSTADVLRQVNNVYAKRLVVGVSVGLERFLEQVKQQAVTDDQLRVFFVEQNARSRKYWTEEERAGQLYEFDPAAYGIDISPKDVEQYYQTRKQTEFVIEPAQIKVQRLLMKVSQPQDKAKVRTQAEAIYQQAKAEGASFDALVEKYADVDARKNGGVLEYFKRGQQEQAFELAAFALGKDGDISGVIETSRGFEIIKRLAKKAATYKSLADVSAEIRNKLAEQRFARIFEQDIKRASLQENKKEALSSIVKQKKATVKEIATTKKNDKKEILSLFSSYKGSFVPYVHAGKGYVVMVTDVRPAAELKLAAIKQRVTDDFYKSQAQRAQAEFLIAARKKLADQGLKDLAQAEKLSVLTLPAVSLDDNKAVEEFTKKYGQVFVENYAALAQVGDTRIFVDGQTGYLLQLSGFEGLSQEALNGKKRVAQAQALQEQERLMGQAFVAYLVKNAKIKFNESIYQ